MNTISLAASGESEFWGSDAALRTTGITDWVWTGAFFETTLSRGHLAVVAICAVSIAHHALQANVLYYAQNALFMRREPPEV